MWRPVCPRSVHFLSRNEQGGGLVRTAWLIGDVTGTHESIVLQQGFAISLPTGGDQHADKHVSRWLVRHGVLTPQTNNPECFMACSRAGLLPAAYSENDSIDFSALRHFSNGRTMALLYGLSA